MERYLRHLVLRNGEICACGYVSKEYRLSKGVRLNCFMLFESILPISSTSVAANQNMATALSLETFWTSNDISGAAES